MSAARSGIGWLIAKAAALGASWLAAAYFARALANPQATLGQFYLFETIVSLSILAANAGTGGAIAQRLSSTTEQGIRDRYLGAGIAILIVRLVVVVVAMVAALPLYDRLFEQGLLIGVLATLLVVVLQIKRVGEAILHGQSRVGRKGVVGLIDSGGQALAQSLFVFLGAGIVGLAGGAIVGSMLAAVFAIIVINKSIKVECPNQKEIRSVVSYTKSKLVSGVATKFYDNIDVLTIRYFLDDAAVGIYGIGFRFALPVQIVSGAIADAMLPEVSKEAAAGNNKRVIEIVSDSLVYAMIIALPASVGGAILAEPLIITAYTEAFVDSALIAVVGITIQIPAGLRSVFNSILDGADRPDVPARAGAILIVANLLLDVILVPTIGPLGAIIASLAAVGVVTVYLGYHVFSIFNLTILDLPLREVGTEIIAALFMGGVVYGLRETLSLANIPLLVISILTGTVVYFVLLIVLSRNIRHRLRGIADDILPAGLFSEE